jgi:hypothetical protein
LYTHTLFRKSTSIYICGTGENINRAIGKNTPEKETIEGKNMLELSVEKIPSMNRTGKFHMITGWTIYVLLTDMSKVTERKKREERKEDVYMI